MTDLKKPTPTASQIRELLDGIQVCRDQAASLHMGLIHYFLDMAATEIAGCLSSNPEKLVAGESTQ